jgi:hypothetical protein
MSSHWSLCRSRCSTITPRLAAQADDTQAPPMPLRGVDCSRRRLCRARDHRCADNIQTQSRPMPASSTGEPTGGAVVDRRCPRRRHCLALSDRGLPPCIRRRRDRSSPPISLATALSSHSRRRRPRIMISLSILLRPLRDVLKRNDAFYLLSRIYCGLLPLHECADIRWRRRGHSCGRVCKGLAMGVRLILLLHALSGRHMVRGDI